jgi:hypothetical protein
MLDFRILSTMAESEIENPNLFPFPFTMHITFAVIGLLFFIYRFITDKKPYQLIFAFAIPFSLTLWLSDSRAWFYTLGAVETVLILGALVTTFIFRDKPEEKPDGAVKAEEKPEPEADEVPGETAAEETAAEQPGQDEEEQ